MDPCYIIRARAGLWYLILDLCHEQRTLLLCRGTYQEVQRFHKVRHAT